jgi:hypothetical protein
MKPMIKRVSVSVRGAELLANGGTLCDIRRVVRNSATHWDVTVSGAKPKMAGIVLKNSGSELKEVVTD